MWSVGKFNLSVCLLCLVDWSHSVSYWHGGLVLLSVLLVRLRVSLSCIFCGPISDFLNWSTNVFPDTSFMWLVVRLLPMVRRSVGRSADCPNAVQAWFGLGQKPPSQPTSQCPQPALRTSLSPASTPSPGTGATPAMNKSISLQQTPWPEQSPEVMQGTNTSTSTAWGSGGWSRGKLQHLSYFYVGFSSFPVTCSISPSFSLG